MFHFVTDKEFLDASRAFCSQVMCRTRDLLHEEDINSQPVLVGSGARNLVTQNENEPIDFDYNLEIMSCEDFDDCKAIKSKVKKCFDKALREAGLSDSNDSTSVLTSKRIYLRGWSTIGFSIDVCITCEDGDQWYRLIHDKPHGYWYNDNWIWNQGYSKHGYARKAKEIKKVPGAWIILREKYLKKKNKYLSAGDKNHPSFVCYVEAVNDLYNELWQKKKIK